MLLSREPWRTLWKRFVLGRALDIEEVPAAGLACCSNDGFAWRSDVDAPWFELRVRGAVPQGWVLVRGRLLRKGADFTTRLRLDLGGGFEAGPVIDLPVSAKGNLLEVVKLPSGIRGMRLEPMQGRGHFEKTPLHLYALGRLGRQVYMTRRVAHALWHEPRARRAQVGLGHWSAFWNLKRAYRQAAVLRHYSPHPSYQLWLQQFDAPSPAERARMRRHARRFRLQPTFHVVVAWNGEDVGALRATLDSLAGQLYPDIRAAVLLPDRHAGDAPAAAPPTLRCRWVRADDRGLFLEQLNASLAERPLDAFVALLRAGDRLRAHALYWVAAVLQGEPGAGLVYTDEDEVSTEGGRRAPRFKPDWSPEHLRATNYVGQLAVFRGREVDFAGGVQAADCGGNVYDLLLRVSEVLAPEWVRHIPAPLCQRPPRPAGDDAAAFERAALQRHLARSGALADVADTRPGCRRLRYALPATPPRVSIVIPNKDRCALLRQCVDSILARTAYADWEILVVDNGSTEPATLAYLDTLRRTARVRVLDDPRPFNFSAMNNLAAEQASGEVLCLLNNDTEVITPDWLDDMLGYLHQRDVGVVGAKLLYPDGRVQHAGDAVGVGGCADHMHSMIDGDAPGYCDRALIAQEVSAVTAACLLTWKTLYRRLGGLNASHLKVAFNDVDYCLRVWEAGYRVIWTPHARLTHHESATRGRHRGPDAVRATRAEAGYVRKRWPDRMRHDPFYNPNLNAAHADFTLSPAPRIDTPWSP